MFLSRRLEAGRVQPLADVRASLGLASPAERFITYRSVGEEFGLFAKSSRFFGEAFFKGAGLLHSPALLHDTLLESFNIPQRDG